MYARLFSIEVVPAGEDPGGVLAWGIEFEDEAITYRKQLSGGQAQFGVHRSAESALKLRRRALPGHELQLVRDDSWDEYLDGLDAESVHTP